MPGRRTRGPPTYSAPAATPGRVRPSCRARVRVVRPRSGPPHPAPGTRAGPVRAGRIVVPVRHRCAPLGGHRVQGNRPQGRRDQQEGPPRLHHPQDVRGGAGAGRHRGEVAARGAGVAGRRLRPGVRGRADAARAAHRRVRLRHLDQPRPTAHPQAAAAPNRDRPDPGEAARGRGDAGAAVALLRQRLGEGGARRWRGASAPTTSGRRSPSATPTGRSPGSWAGASRAVPVDRSGRTSRIDRPGLPGGSPVRRGRSRRRVGRSPARTGRPGQRRR